MRHAMLTCRAFWELIRYDILTKLRGFRVVYQEVARLRPRSGIRPLEETIPLRAAELAISLYWKPVRCLQRSVVTARLLRKCGIDGVVVIGCRPVPFAAHAWVEIGGHSGDGPPRLNHLTVIDRF